MSMRSAQLPRWRKLLERAANIATVEMKGALGGAALCQLCFGCRKKRRVVRAKPVHAGTGFRLATDQAAKSEPVDKTASALRPMFKNQRIDIGAPVEGGQLLTRHG